MRCLYCNGDHPEGTLFCPITGAKITAQIQCQLCGQWIDENALFCPDCGSPLKKRRKALPNEMMIGLIVTLIAIFSVTFVFGIGYYIWLIGNNQAQGALATQVGAKSTLPALTSTAKPGSSNANKNRMTLEAEVSVRATALAASAVPAPTDAPTPTRVPTAVSLKWTSQTADSSTRGGLYSTLFVDKNDTLHIAYLDNENDKLLVFIYDQLSWHIVRMPGKSRSGWYPSMTMDPSGNLYISYWAFGKDWISYFYQYNHQWVAGPQLNNVQPTGTAITIDSTNRVGIYFIDRNDGWLKFAVQTNSGWDIRRVSQPYPPNASIPDEGANIALAEDSTGDVHLAYSSSTQGLVYQRVKNGAVEAAEKVDGAIGTGLFPSITLNSLGSPVISYYDPSRQCLKLAEKEGPNWKTRIIDQQGNVGQYSSVKAGSSGDIFMSYYDADNSALKFVRVSGENKEFEVVDQDGVGKWSSLALDDRNLPRISYYDEKNQHLKFARAEIE